MYESLKDGKFSSIQYWKSYTIPSGVILERVPHKHFNAFKVLFCAKQEDAQRLKDVIIQVPKHLEAQLLNPINKTSFDDKVYSSHIEVIKEKLEDVIGYSKSFVSKNKLQEIFNKLVN